MAQLADVPPRFEKRLRRQRKALPRLWARRIPGMPYGSGPLEEALDEINRSIRHRRFRFRNLGRLERVLAMMAKQAALRIHAEKALKQQHQLHRELTRAWEKGQPIFD